MIGSVLFVGLKCVMKNRLTKFRCWQNSLNDYDLEILANRLFVKIKVQQTFKWVQIVSLENVVVISKIYLTNECQIKLPMGVPGKYLFYFFVSNNGFSYNGYIGGHQIVLEYDNVSGWGFKLAQYALWNKNLISSNRMRYVLNDTLLPNSKTIIAKTKSITSNCSCLKEQILKVHDFIAENLYYDCDLLRSTETNRTIEQIVRLKRCVCQGYADMALVMLHSIGVVAQNILCYANRDIRHRGWSNSINQTSDLNHIITRAKVENRWLYMDITWDSNNTYENGKFIKGAQPSHLYFDVTIPFLSATHRFFENIN